MTDNKTEKQTLKQIKNREYCKKYREKQNKKIYINDNNDNNNKTDNDHIEEIDNIEHTKNYFNDDEIDRYINKMVEERITEKEKLFFLNKNNQKRPQIPQPTQQQENFIISTAKDTAKTVFQTMILTSVPLLIRYTMNNMKYLNFTSKQSTNNIQTQDNARPPLYTNLNSFTTQ